VPKVLIVEDDEAMARALVDGFAFEGYTVLQARDGQTGLKMAKGESPDIILLDVMLPKLSGIDVCREIRAAGGGVPIIMLTARGQEIDKVLGLKSGADDYVTKPFGFMELMARIEAVLRRAAGRSSTAPRDDTYTFGDIAVDFRKSEVRRKGKAVEMTAREFRLLRHFIEHRDEVVTRDQLLDSVWDYDEPPLTRTVDMHVAKLRKKIEDHPDEPRWLVTVHRAGYKFKG
jgi:two-component system alkaline phosphatase synthesis response regulator PhoP